MINFAGFKAVGESVKKPIDYYINNMPIVSSNYWNNIHGHVAEDVKQDLEGLQIMRNLGHNMAWILKCIELGKASGINHPTLEEKICTNFIR